MDGRTQFKDGLAVCPRSGGRTGMRMSASAVDFPREVDRFVSEPVSDQRITIRPSFHPARFSADQQSITPQAVPRSALTPGEGLL